MEKQNKQRLEQLVRQGLVPSRKLPMLMQAMSSLHMGKQLTPTERDILAKYMHNMTDIMLKDDTVFNRTKLHTQRTKYQTEETTVDLDEKMVDGVEILDGPEDENKKMKMKKKEKDMKESREGDEEERMRKKEENKARRLSIRKRDKFRMLPTELKKEKMKAGVEEEVINFNDMYKEQFEAALEYYGVDNIRDLPEEKKAEFFKVVDVALEEAKMAKKDHDGDGKVETSTAEYMGSKDKAIKKAMKKEEVEQVDELKKSTLSSYIQKAADPTKKNSNSNLASKGAYKLGRADDDDILAGEKEDRKAFVRSKGIQTAAKKLAKEETEQLDEYGNPAATPDRLAMIRRAADRVQSGQAAKDVKKIAKSDMKQKGAQKGMAPTKKDVEEQVMAIRKVIKEGSTKEKIEAYKELNTIIEQFKSTGEL
ncbi:hypothetical protein N9H34_00365 [bacterium]|nr:hypothetical protein [bacterium]